MAGFRRYYKKRRYSKKRHYKRKRYSAAYRKGYWKAKRVDRRKSGVGNKVGIYYAELGCKIYISRRKYKTMKVYARLMVNCHLYDHNHKDNSGANNTNDIKGHVQYSKRDYRKMIHHVIIRMLQTNWYHNWYMQKNLGLAEQAYHVLTHEANQSRIVPGIKNVEHTVEKIGEHALSSVKSMFSVKSVASVMPIL